MPLSGSTKSGNIGDFKFIGHGSVPNGWLMCYGQAISRVTYAALFAIIGTAFGAGDGSTTFNLPDMRGRALFAKDDMGGSAANRLTTGGGGVNGASLGAVGGGETVTLSTTTMPSHGHQQTYTQSTSSAFGCGGVSGISHNNAGANTTVANGSSGAHQNIPPAMVANLIIRAF